MNTTDLSNLIQKCVDAAVRAAFKDLGIEKKVKLGQTAYKKTEQILWNYPMFKQVRNDKFLQIEELKTAGVPSKSKSILEYQPGSHGTGGLETDEEKTQAAIQVILEEIEFIDAAIAKIDLALESVMHENAYPVLIRYYFDKEPITDLAASFGVDQGTISRWKSKLVRKLATHLFPKEAIGELMED